MIDFLSAALPWVFIGIAIVLVIVNFSRKKKKSNIKKPETSDKANPHNTNSEDNYLSVGMSFGMCVGIVLGSIGIVPLAYGISFGMLFGLIVGMLIKKN